MGQPIRVLHLEDSPRDAELIAARLNAVEGTYAIVPAAGQVSFESLVTEAEQHFDVILCDYNILGYDGLAAVQFVRKARPDLPVIVISGMLGEEATVECLKAGATDFLLKHNLGRLTSAIARAMDEASERRKLVAAERALIEAERFARSTLDALSSHIAILDEDGFILAVNRAWREFAKSNSPAPQAEAIGVNYLAVCDAACGPGDETAGEFAAGIREVIRGERDSFTLEYACHSPEQKRWFIGLVTRFFGNGPVRIVVAHENITERKLAEEQLQSSKQRFLNIFEFSADAIVITNHEGIIVQANRQVGTVFGWDPAELVGKSVEILMPTQWRHGHTELRKHYQQSGLPGRMGSGRKDLVGLRKDGSEFPVNISLSPFETPDGLLVSAAIRDVSVHHQAEMALRDLKVFADTVIENVSGLFFVFGTDGLFLRWNQRLQELLGLSSDQMLKTNALSIVHEADQERVAREIAKVFATGYAEADVRLVFKHSTRHYTLSARRSEINGTMYLVGSGADITEHKEAAERVLQLNQTLEQRVYERTEELAATNVELKQASQAKSEFLATMSHELRTPLNGIMGMNELLLRTELSDQQLQYVEACNSSSKMLMLLINDILDLTKIEAGKLELDTRKCDLESLIYDVAEVMSHAVHAKGLTLQCSLAPDARVLATCDDNRMRQILFNLIGNAIKFTSSGSITITVNQVAEQGGTARLRFAVTDTGLGIPAERHGRLFKVFSQVDSSTTRQFGGTGLGLAICKQLVELMGGEIGVESQVGVGTTFWFEIDMATSSLTVEDRGRRLLAETRILAIDCLDQERQQLAEYLHSWNCSFEHVATAGEALVAVQSANAAGRPFHVVLADCRLVVGDEFELLKNLAARPDVNVIGLGCPPDDLFKERLLGLGVRHILHDPIRPSVLFNTLASVLSVTKGSASREGNRSTQIEQPAIKLSGHILVAEDNRINQLYIVELLKHFGCTCDVVMNGEEALAAVGRQQYDLVLMDCQMPDMDGFSATREIRKREMSRQFASRTPIIALTANALKGDRERCIESGMDDYLSKPLENTKLHAVLTKLLKRPSLSPPTIGEGI